MSEIFRYYKIGSSLVKAKYNDLGIKCVYKFNFKTKDFDINNSLIEEIIADNDVKPLRREEFEKLISV